MRPFLTLHDPARAREYYDKGLWTDDTFYSLMAGHASARPDDIAYRDGKNTLTWRELSARVETFAAALEKKGLVPGDRVSVWMSNRIEPVIACLACSRGGHTINPSLHSTNTCAEVGELLRRLDSAVLITEEGWGADRGAGKLEAEIEKLPGLHTVYTPETFPESGPAPTRPPVLDSDSVAYLAFTSGTTGAPKCVMHSDNTLMSNARDMARDWKLDHATRILTLSPLSHHIAWVAVSQWLICGGQLIIDAPPAGMSRLDWIVETGATYVLGVPTHAMDILSAQREAGLERIGDVEIFYMAGAPIPPVVCEAFIRLGIKPQNIYGMTENSSHQYTHPDDDPDVWIHTCGRGGPAYEVLIVDAENRDLPAAPGATGQIAGRGAALMLGYFGNQEATQDSFNRDGWFLSGDLGRMDENGNLHIDGRLKDLIIRGGHNIYPSHIEALALRSERIEKAAAFPVPDDRLGEKVCLAVIGDIGPDDALAHLDAEGLSKYDMPEYFLNLESFPLTASGKILKRELIEMHRRGEIDPLSIRFQANKEAV
ncbi:MAG: class I adenylate-forming enzyme family protein [Alphaproteobacteria bacterium]